MKKEPAAVKRGRPKTKPKANTKQLTSKVVSIKQMTLNSKPDRPKVKNKTSAIKEKKTTAKTGHSSKTKPFVTKVRKPSAKAKGPSPKKAADTRLQKPSRGTAKPAAKPAPKKTGTRKPRQTLMTKKSADALTKVLIPAGWKPSTKRSSSTKRNVRPPKAKDSSKPQKK